MGIVPLLVTPDRRVHRGRRRSTSCWCAGSSSAPSARGRRVGAAAIRRLPAVLRRTPRSCSLFSGLVSAIHVPGGTFIHSAVALAPYSYILALEGVGVARASGSRRDGRPGRRSWRPGCSPARRSSFERGDRVARGRQRPRHVGRPARQGDDDRRRVRHGRRSPRPTGSCRSTRAGRKYATGCGGVVLVNDPLDAILDVGVAYDIRWIVLDRADSVRSVAPILDKDERPAWIGPPIYSERGTGLNAGRHRRRRTRWGSSRSASTRRSTRAASGRTERGDR